MDEKHPPQEVPNLDSNLPDQTENDADDSVTPDRQPTESDVISPELQDAHLDGRNLNSSDENSENDDRSTNRIDMNGDIGDSEILIQRHPPMPSAMVSMNNESSFTCKYPGCNFTSFDAEAYLKHEDTHVDGGTALCDICNIRFPTYANMRRHQLYIHQGIRTFECQFCSKRFLRKEQFMEHLVRHSKPSTKQFQCTFCGVSFHLRNQLRSHLTTEHSGLILDRTCNLCDFKASSPNAAKIHYATYHLKHMGGSDSNRPHDLIHRIPIHPTESGAIDLATVSQNFSFMTAQYPSYSASTSDAIAPGPSDLSRTSKLIPVPSSVPNLRSVIAQTSDHNAVLPNQEEDNRHTCISSLAGSTTIVSPPSCQDRACPHSEVLPTDRLVLRKRFCIKPEPPELVVDDSQNSNVQPTSTMDLSTTEVVGTTCVTSNEAGTSETPCRRKVHKHSSTDDTGSESHYSPTTRHCLESHAASQTKTPHTCCRFRPYEESSQRCREYARHTCTSHRYNSERRPRYSDSDIDRGVHIDHSDGEERKVFYSRATSTNLFAPMEVHISRSSHAIAQGDAGPESHPESNCYNRKNSIVIRDIESCTLTCVYCGIIFPDQTLYLLHRSLHSEGNPWKCNLCGKTCKDKYDFNSHVISKGHY